MWVRTHVWASADRTGKAAGQFGVGWFVGSLTGVCWFADRGLFVCPFICLFHDGHLMNEGVEIENNGGLYTTVISQIVIRQRGKD